MEKDFLIDFFVLVMLSFAMCAFAIFAIAYSSFALVVLAIGSGVAMVLNLLKNTRKKD